MNEGAPRRAAKRLGAVGGQRCGLHESGVAAGGGAGPCHASPAEDGASVRAAAGRHAQRRRRAVCTLPALALPPRAFSRRGPLSRSLSPPVVIVFALRSSCWAMRFLDLWLAYRDWCAWTPLLDNGPFAVVVAKAMRGKSCGCIVLLRCTCDWTALGSCEGNSSLAQLAIANTSPGAWTVSRTSARNVRQLLTWAT